MRKFVTALAFVFLAMGTLVVPVTADDGKKDWEINTIFSFWSKYVTTGGFVASPNPSFQPEITFQHKSGFYNYEWASLDMKTGRLTEVDYEFGYRGELPIGGLKIDVGVAYFQLDKLSDQVEAYVWMGKTFKFHGHLTVFVKEEVPYELDSGRVASWSYVGARHELPITDKLSLIQQPQLVAGYCFGKTWSSSFAYDAMLPYEISKKLAVGPSFKLRIPLDTPGNDPRKNEWAIGGVMAYKF